MKVLHQGNVDQPAYDYIVVCTTCHSTIVCDAQDIKNTRPAVTHTDDNGNIISIIYYAQSRVEYIECPVCEDWKPIYSQPLVLPKGIVQNI